MRRKVETMYPPLPPPLPSRPPSLGLFTSLSSLPPTSSARFGEPSSSSSWVFEDLGWSSVIFTGPRFLGFWMDAGIGALERGTAARTREDGGAGDSVADSLSESEA